MSGYQLLRGDGLIAGGLYPRGDGIDVKLQGLSRRRAASWSILDPSKEGRRNRPVPPALSSPFHFLLSHGPSRRRLSATLRAPAARRRPLSIPPPPCSPATSPLGSHGRSSVSPPRLPLPYRPSSPSRSRPRHPTTLQHGPPAKLPAPPRARARALSRPQWSSSRTRSVLWR